MIYVPPSVLDAVLNILLGVGASADPILTNPNPKVHTNQTLAALIGRPGC